MGATSLGNLHSTGSGGNNAGGFGGRIAAKSNGRRIAMNAAVFQSQRFSILGAGRLLVTIRQTAGAPGGVATLTEFIEGQNADTLDQLAVAAIDTTYRMESMVAGSEVQLTLSTIPAGGTYIVTIQATGTS